MNDVILLVGHGSRSKAGNEEIYNFAEQWRARNPRWHIETCFIEFADVLLDKGFDIAATKGSRVVVVPLILNAAGHVKMELPAHLAEARLRHPNTEFILSRHLGATDPILSILKRELRQAMSSLDMPDPRASGVVILGRGSSDRIANGEVSKMARWLFEETDHELVDVAFTGVTFPRIETVVQRQVQLGMTQIIVMPYYLFTGTLVERIERQVQHLRQQYPTVRFAKSNYFGFADEIFEVLNQRVRENIEIQDGPNMLECDGCKYRKIAEEHGHGHHHHGDDQSHAHDHHCQEHHEATA